LNITGKIQGKIRTVLTMETRSQARKHEKFLAAVKICEELSEQTLPQRQYKAAQIQSILEHMDWMEKKYPEEHNSKKAWWMVNEDRTGEQWFGFAKNSRWWVYK